MRILSAIELANTRVKLRELQEFYAARQSEAGEDTEIRELSRRSLMRLINQLKEEIAVSEIKQTAGGKF